MKKLIVLLSAVIAVVQIGRSATFDVKVPEGTKNVMYAASSMAGRLLTQ